MPTAIAGRSDRPSFGKSAGDKLTVMRPGGKLNPAVNNAERTRSLLSRTAVSGSPTMKKQAGRTQVYFARTNGADRPAEARLRTTLTGLASIADARQSDTRLLRRKFRFELFQPRLERGQHGPCPRQKGRLNVEFLAADQIEAC